ncbi:MAG: FtsX-like permease family protein [Bacteroidetes bacterium]|nr:MAG: FtsX-like permease family protein [Bacteroidota bacterium]
MKQIVTTENLKISIVSIRSHLLRTFLTILIIAFGIMAIVGILTSIDSIKASITSSFSRLGANSFSIRNREMFVVGGGQPQNFRHITFNEAMLFKESYSFPASVSVSVWGTGNAVVRFRSEETNPNISVTGSDDNYIITSGYELESGRNFSPWEMETGANVAIIGGQLSHNLFKNNEDPLGQFVTIGNNRYQVIGVLKERGTTFGFSGDQNVILPVMAVRQNFSRPNMNFGINVSTDNIAELETAISEATGVFRVVRGLRPGEKNNFDISKSDNIAQMLIENLRQITFAATIIGIITLVGAAIGLMNIMLVSVTERTREIGIRKALGATRKTIKQQFLAEAVVICQLGGVLGIILGILVGNVISYFIGNPFIVPWKWIIIGILLCTLVGLVAGYYPAAKASRLDPIDSLRYE